MLSLTIYIFICMYVCVQYIEDFFHVMYIAPFEIADGVYALCIQSYII